MATVEIRRCYPLSVTELERRRRAVRERMPAAGLDAIIVQGMNNFNGSGGYFRWFTGVSVTSSYPFTIIFRKNEPMTLVGHGAFGEEVTPLANAQNHLYWWRQSRRGDTMPDSGANIRYGWRTRIGMLLPSGNVAAEPQIAAMLPQGVSLHTTRLKLTGSSNEQLLAMTEHVEEGAELLADAGVDLILFHCTAVSMWDAEMDRSLLERIASATKLPATATSRALIAAFRALNAQRIVLVSPYIDAINQREQAFLEGHQMTVLSATGLGISDAKDMIKVEPVDWYRLVRANQAPEADAYFISCTAVRSLEVIEMLERDLGKPVVTSNQAAAWHALRYAGINDAMNGYGCLLRLQ